MLDGRFRATVDKGVEPIGEGMQLFTAVQRKGIDSKILIFPDEGHWVLKPQNSQLWFHTVLDWLDKYLQPVSATE